MELVPLLLHDAARVVLRVVGPPALVLRARRAPDNVSELAHRVALHRQPTVLMVVHPAAFVRLVDVHEVVRRVGQPRRLRHPLQGRVNAVVDLLTVPVQPVRLHSLLLHVRPAERAAGHVSVVMRRQRVVPVALSVAVVPLEVKPVEEQRVQGATRQREGLPKPEGRTQRSRPPVSGGTRPQRAPGAQPWPPLCVRQVRRG